MRASRRDRHFARRGSLWLPTPFAREAGGVPCCCPGESSTLGSSGLPTSSGGTTGGACPPPSNCCSGGTADSYDVDLSAGAWADAGCNNCETLNNVFTVSRTPGASVCLWIYRTELCTLPPGPCGAFSHAYDLVITASVGGFFPSSCQWTVSVQIVAQDSSSEHCSYQATYRSANFPKTQSCIGPFTLALSSVLGSGGINTICVSGPPATITISPA